MFICGLLKQTNTLSKHFENASSHLYSAGSSIYTGAGKTYEFGKNIFSVVSKIFSGEAKQNIADSWNHYKEKIDLHVAVPVAVKSVSEGYALNAVKFGVVTCVAYPVATATVLLAGTMLAADPNATFDAAKNFGGAAYNFASAVAEVSVASGEIAVGLGVEFAEILGIYSIADEDSLGVFGDFIH